MKKLTLYALTYHPRSGNWTSKIVTKKSAKRSRGTSLVYGTSPRDALARLSEKSYRKEK